MTDFGRSDRDLRDEDRLPWLEAVDEDEAESGPSTTKMIAGVLVALVAIGLVIGGVFWLKDRGGDVAGAPEVIAAPAGDYKVRPAEPGGLNVQGSGDSAYAASQGNDPSAPIDLGGMPEAPLTGDRVTAVDAAAPPATAKPSTTPTTQVGSPTIQAPAQAKAATAKPTVAAKPAPAKTPVVPAEPAPVTGGIIQLGAFSSEAKANAAWATLSKRFAVLAPLAKSVVPVASGGGTLYRLRATAGGQAASICARLKVAGDSCVVVGN
jgi:hypothetical protein